MAGMAHENRTSYILRGKMVREAMFCTVVPPPPPGVDASETNIPPTATAQERSVLHRTKPECASCHELFDPLGFAFEIYDAVGRFRVNDAAGKPIDSRATIAATAKIDGAVGDALELTRRLGPAEEVQDCVARQWLRFALGRELDETEDASTLSAVLKATNDSGGKVVRHPRRRRPIQRFPPSQGEAMKLLRTTTLGKSNPTRRQLLKALGLSAAAYPLMPTLNGWAQEGAQPLRLLLTFTSSGVVPEQFNPTGSETAFNFPAGGSTEPLNKHKGDIIFFKGLKRGASGGGGHEQSTGGVWTGNSCISSVGPGALGRPDHRQGNPQADRLSVVPVRGALLLRGRGGHHLQAQEQQPLHHPRRPGAEDRIAV